MEIEINVKGDSYEDNDELQIFMRSKEIYSKLSGVRELIRRRRKHCEDVTDKEDDFLEEIQLILFVEGLD